VNRKLAEAAVKFYQSDSERETYVAVALVALLVAPVVHRWYVSQT